MVAQQGGSPALIRRTCVKKRRDWLMALASGHPDWAQGFLDETWWSRFAQPNVHTWCVGDGALRLVKQSPTKTDPDPKALACYGMLGGVRILVCRLPTKSPWLNRLEPKWAHGKRCIVEPEAALSAEELVDRVCAVFDCEHEPHLAISKKVT
jgi:hypothetical protein